MGGRKVKGTPGGGAGRKLSRDLWMLSAVEEKRQSSLHSETCALSVELRTGSLLAPGGQKLGRWRRRTIFLLPSQAPDPHFPAWLPSPPTLLAIPVYFCVQRRRRKKVGQRHREVYYNNCTKELGLVPPDDRSVQSARGPGATEQPNEGATPV